MRRIPPHRRLPAAIALAAVVGLAVGALLYVHPGFGGGGAAAATLPTSIRTRTIPGHTVTRLKRVRVRHVVYRNGKRVVTFQTVTRPVSVFVPPTTVQVTGPAQTTTRTVDGTIFRTVTLPGQTVTQTLPGQTVTDTLPGSTVTETQPGTTVTDTLPGTTVTSTETLPGTTDTVTVTVTEGGGGST